MLDKSVPYKNIIMRVEADRIADLPQLALPQGFSLRNYRPGDAENWARIETSVLEFASEADALQYFVKTFLPQEEMLKNRCFFVLNENGLPIATATAWFETVQNNHRAMVHWVAVCPKYQGLGLGKAVTQAVLRALAELEKGKPVFLHTQTWSHRAVRMYHGFGFNMVKAEGDYGEAITVLKSVLSEAEVQALADTAV